MENLPSEEKSQNPNFIERKLDKKENNKFKINWQELVNLKCLKADVSGVFECCFGEKRDPVILKSCTSIVGAMFAGEVLEAIGLFKCPKT